MDGGISNEEHDSKRNQLIQKREYIITEIEDHGTADDKFSECLINLVEFASGALETFKGSTIERKSKLLN